MAKKYVNFRVGGSPYKVTDDYSVWTNDLLGKIIASKTVIQPGKSTVGHRLSGSDVVYIIVNGRGLMEVVDGTQESDGMAVPLVSANQDNYQRQIDLLEAKKSFAIVHIGIFRLIFNSKNSTKVDRGIPKEPVIIKAGI